MKRSLLYLCGLFIILAIPFAAQAAPSPGGITDQVTNFTPEPTDTSVQYLSQLFGTVGGVLHGAQTQVMGQIFKVLNYGIITIFGLFVIYIVFKGVIATAADGEIMGRGNTTKMGWLATRSVIGMSLLIPSKVTGYSVIQTIVMWIVLQSVGLANVTWDRILTYLHDEGGQVYITSNFKADNVTQALPGVLATLQDQVCVFKANELRDTKAAEYKDVKFGHSFNSATGKLSFGILNKYNQADSACGSLQWPLQKDTKKSLEPRLELAAEQMLLTLQPAVKLIANSDGTYNDAEKVAIKNSITEAMLDYYNITRPAIKQTESDANKQFKKSFEEAKEKGWMLAGSYYWMIANANKRIQADLNSFVPDANQTKILKYEGGDNSDINHIVKKAGIIQKTNLQSAIQRGNAIGSDSTLNVEVTDTLVKILDNNPTKQNDALSWKKLANSGTMAVGVFSAMGLAGGAPTAGVFLAASSTIMTGILVPWNEMIGKDNGKDPIQKLQQFGATVTNASFVLWTVILGILMAAVTVSSVMNSVHGLGSGVQAALSWALPPLGLLLTATFGIGLILSVYIPLIPYLIFTFATIGWFIAVLEAMVAAPLIALGISHPESHDQLGKAEQALMLLFSLFLRPILLIIGLVAGIILARLSVNIVNSGFETVVDLASITGPGDIYFFATFALLIAYVLLVMYLINFSFNTIPLLTDRVMRWIGVGGDQNNYQEGLSAVRGGISQGGQMGGQAGSGTFGAAKQSWQKAAQGVKAQGGAGKSAWKQWLGGPKA